MPIETEVSLRPLLAKLKLKCTNIYFQKYLDDEGKKLTLVIETPLGITRDMIKTLEKSTNTRFIRIDVRESPLLDYQPVVECRFARA